MSLTAFTDFIASTGTNVFRGPRDVVNDAVKSNYGALHFLWRGQRDADILQGGKDISDTIYLEAVRRSRTYKPNDPQSITMPQTLTNWAIPWRFVITDMAWTDEEVTLNAGAELSDKARAQKFKDLKYQKERDTKTDHINHLDDMLWAVPDTTKMESASGQEPYSIPCFVNEFTNGLPSAAHPGGVWTTKQGISPAAAGKSRWQAQRFTYSSAGPPVATVAAGTLIAQLDKAFHKTEFSPPPMHADMFEPTSNNSMRVVFTSLAGKVNLMNSLRAANDRWNETQDPATGFFNLMYKNVPIVYCAQLDTAAIFPTGASAALSTELDTAGTDNAGPRYFGINTQYLRPVTHRERFFNDLGIKNDITQPTTFAKFFNSYINLAARSLQRQFIVYPAGVNEITNY